MYRNGVYDNNYDLRSDPNHLSYDPAKEEETVGFEDLDPKIVEGEATRKNSGVPRSKEKTRQTERFHDHYAEKPKV